MEDDTNRPEDLTLSDEDEGSLRCCSTPVDQLFVIITLGESILVTGTTFGEIETSVATLVAFVVAFLASVTLWWIYFARAAEAAREVFASS